ncbi:hypothetical protein BBJ28_00006620 [Nothophytophthora sp. Chile5]|nr:hypothetical protein BBJ28_00006620 [Nothophytophthora sp. Chile5]
MAGTRLQIVGSFVLFALLASPIAWFLTQVERVPLPVERIQQLSWNASRFAGPDKFEVTIYSQDPVNKAGLLTSSGPHVVYKRKTLDLDASQSVALKRAISESLQATDDALETLVSTEQERQRRFDVFLLCNQDATDSPLLVVGKHRHAWSSQCAVSQGDAVHAAIERLTQRHLFPSGSSPSDQQVAPTETRAARMALRYRLEFSLLKEDPATPWNVNLATLVERYMGALIQKLGAVAAFTVETQVTQYARLAKEVTPNADGTEFYLNAADLKQVRGFKSTNDFLDASVLDDGEQVLHFMAALPEATHSPLFIRPDDGKQQSGGLATSFELPGWGIAVILNPHALSSSPAASAVTDEVTSSPAATKEKELQRAMGLFVTQFRTLLGVPSFIQRQRSEDASRRTLLFLPSPMDGIADWELDEIMRSRFKRHMQAAIETLQSTVELVETLPELSVLQRVQTRVETAVTRLEAILCNQQQQQECIPASDLRNLLVLARQAAALTDAAYYDHTMIRQLYFPQEQMLGVYAPLLAPLILPFLLGFVRELRRWKAKRAAKKKKKEKKLQ